jgi:hypothetical protein
MTDMSQFIRKLALSGGFVAPRRLSHGDIEAIALSREDLEDDLIGINGSIEVIQRTRGGGWPEGPVEPGYNYIDLVWHEQEFREGSSFSYVVRHRDGSYLGCCYLYPMGLRTELTDALLDHDVDVSWWVTQTAYEAGYYEALHEALREWIAAEFPFSNPFFSNREVPPEKRSA